jgi:hypothetical protein
MNSAPPKIQASPVAGWLVWGGLSAAAIALAVLVYFFNPATHQFYPACQFHRLTGLNCPGCGMTRAVYALLHGEFLAALRDNALLVGVGCLAAVRAGWLAFAKIRGRPAGKILPEKWLWLLLAATLLFGLLRNLPAFAFLSP